MQKRRVIGKARIYQFENGKFRVVFKGRETTPKELRNEITKLIVEEMKCAENAAAKPTE